MKINDKINRAKEDRNTFFSLELWVAQLLLQNSRSHHSASHPKLSRLVGFIGLELLLMAGEGICQLEESSAETVTAQTRFRIRDMGCWWQYR